MTTINYGHIRKDGVVQTLEDHLQGTANLAESFTSQIGLENVGRVLGLLHDLGKASKEFRDYILGESDFHRGEVDHSTAGAQYIHLREERLNGSNLGVCAARQMLELAIVSHHSGMMDCISVDGADVYRRRMGKNDADTHLLESMETISPSILEEVESIIPVAERSLSSLIMSMLDESRSCFVKDKGHMRLGLLSRFILSCLIDADRIDTSNFMDSAKDFVPKADWTALSSKLEVALSLMGGNDAVSTARKTVSAACLASSGLGQGVFSLSVPTGGGKTLASLRFALNHASKHNMRRIIYVIPYTTIIEQNAEVVRRILEDENHRGLVLECHSGIDVNDTSDSDYIWSEASDNWDSPIIFTTMVQFLETLYSSGTKRIRRMHNLADSILIFDEIQTIPIKTVYMFNEALSFLTGRCGCSAVLCTATQPLLDCGLDYNAPISREIIDDVLGLSKVLRRTEIQVDCCMRTHTVEELCGLAIRVIEDVRSLLIVVNTKRMARVVYESLSSTLHNVELFHLSTGMCPAHRKEVFSRIRSCLGNTRMICISTQLIEAGVDIDFDSVIRCMAGLDSVVQAAGRCNRNGKLGHLGKVYVIKTDEYLGMLPDILEGRRCTEQVISEGHSDLLTTEAMRRYFEIYFYRRRHEMSYCIGMSETTLFDMLSQNAGAVRLYRSINGVWPPEVLRQSFREANSRFKVIESKDSIVVPYDDEARDVIASLAIEQSIAERVSKLRFLQRYSVNTHMLASMIRSGMAFEITPGCGIYCLADGYYDEVYGITMQFNGNLLLF